MVYWLSLLCWVYDFPVPECSLTMPTDPNELKCEDRFSEAMCTNCLSKAEEYARDCLTSLLSTSSYSLQSMIDNYNCSGYTTTTSTCSQVAALTSVIVKITSTVGCPSTTATVSLAPITVATTSVLTTTVKASCNAMPTSANSLEIPHIAISSGVLTTILVMTVVVLLVVALIAFCLYIKLKKQCTCMQCILVECVPVYVLI